MSVSRSVPTEVLQLLCISVVCGALQFAGVLAVASYLLQIHTLAEFAFVYAPIAFVVTFLLALASVAARHESLWRDVQQREGRLRGRTGVAASRQG